jgi:IS4 transposase
MKLDPVLERFAAKAPISLMLRATLEHAFTPDQLNQLFGRVAQQQYTRQLTFDTVVGLLLRVVLRVQPSVHAAYRHGEPVNASLAAVYQKLNGVEPAVTEALVHHSGTALGRVFASWPVRRSDPIPGLRLRTLDGNFLAGAEHRLAPLRDSGAAALPGMSLVVRDDRTGLLTDLVACEDAYTSEKALFDRVRPLVQANDLWLTDRGFCTMDYLAGFAERGAFFLVRHHAGTHLEPVGPLRARGRNASGRVFEQRVRLRGTGGRSLVCRCVRIRLDQPLRDGATEMRLLSNVPASQASARTLADLYRQRWEIEHSFQDLTEALQCEVETLAYPRAALLGFALAVVAYNVLQVIQAALAHAHGPKVDRELSLYHLARDVASGSEGLTIAVGEEQWQAFQAMTADQLATWLAGIAAGLRWQRYRKSPRGPKKPPHVKRTQRGAHRSTARVLAEQKG